MIRLAFASVVVIALLPLFALGEEAEKPALVKVAAVQMLGYDKTDLPRPGFDPSETVVQYIDRAAKDGAELVAFPEYLLGRISVPGPQTERISKAAAAGRIYVIVGCWEVFDDSTFANTALLFDREGKIVGKYNKVHAAVDHFEGEPPWSKPPQDKDADWFIKNDPEWMMKRGDDFPVFDLDFGRIGILTCYDGWFPETFRILSLNGAELLVWINGTTEIAGSVTGKAIAQEELDELPGHYGAVAKALLDTHEIKTAGKTVVTVEDVAIFLVLLRFFTANMNTDGSLPVKRWQNLWQALFEAGDIERAFCPQRFKVIRDYLSSLKLLDWQDETFRLGWYDEDGNYHKGRACKWRAGERVMEMLEQNKEGLDSATCREGRGETSFIRTDVLPMLQSIVPQSLEETKKPFLIDCDTHLQLSPDDLAPLITTFPVFSGIAA